MSLLESKKLENNEVSVKFLIDAKTFDESCDRVYRRRAKQFKLPGFRAGRVPRKIVEKNYGEDIFFEDALQEAYPKFLDAAVGGTGFDIVGVENLKIVEADLEKGAVLEAICALKPEVTIKNYKGFEIEKTVKRVKKKDIDDRLKAMRERAARISLVEDRAAKMGDLVVLDFEGFVDGISFAGGQAKNYSLKLGSGQFIKGFEEKIVGHKSNDEFEIEVKFPKDYASEDLKGKTAMFKCKLHEIKKVELPDEDDEFAKDVSEFDSLDKLKNHIKSDLKKQNLDEANAKIDSVISSKLVEAVEVALPNVMINNRVNEIVYEFEYGLRARGLSLASYLNRIGLSFDEFKKQFVGRAIGELKIRLALEKIAEVEALAVDGSEIEAEFESVAKKYGLSVDRLKTNIDRKTIEKEILNRKALELVKNNAKIVEESVNK